ncbi:MAG TPA: DUF1320 domain-containing protein [bacterium]|nr:DUF1320 domain-containing protein [bacterium]
MANFVSNQEVREQAGFQYKERAVALTGDVDGSNTIFYVPTRNLPIVDRDYDGDVDVNDIVVYGNGTDTAVSAVVAASGKITLTIAPPSGYTMTGDFDWSPLDDTTVTNYINEAHSLVLSKLSEVYDVPLSETPDVIKLIEKKLAAGLLLDKEYSVGGDETEDTRGRRWIKWAEEKLEEIVSGNLELLDSNGNVLAQKTSGAGVKGWPDNTTKDASEANSGGAIKFRIKKEF